MLSWLLVLSALALGACEVPTVVPRRTWAVEASHCDTPLARPAAFLITHHVPGLPCGNRTTCTQRLRELQDHHTHNNSWCGLAYNFLVGDDGRVYEGVGWAVQGAHTQGYNNVSLGLAFFGMEEGRSPSPAALSAMEGLVALAVLLGHLSPTYSQPVLVKGENCLAPKQRRNPTRDCPRIVPRSEWEARETRCPKMTPPAKYVIIIQTAGRTCNMSEECRLLVRDLQALFMDRYGACDTRYNFLVGQNGVVYEGLGWDREGSHTSGYNDISLGIAFIGTFSGAPPNAAALEVARDLIQCAVDKGHLVPDYLLVGQCDVTNTLSPGQALYNIIRTWPHYQA